MLRSNPLLQGARELTPAIQPAFLVTCDLGEEAAGHRRRLRELKTRNDFLTILVVNLDVRQLITKRSTLCVTFQFIRSISLR